MGLVTLQSWRKKKPPIEANLNQYGNIRLSITFACPFPLTCSSLLASTKRSNRKFWNLKQVDRKLQPAIKIFQFYFLKKKKIIFRIIDKWKKNKTRPKKRKKKQFQLTIKINNKKLLFFFSFLLFSQHPNKRVALPQPQHHQPKFPN